MPRLLLEVEESQSQLLVSTHSLQQTDGKRLNTLEVETAPLCACGCGKQVKKRRGKWNLCVNGHTPKRRVVSEAEKIAASIRMTLDNPMKKQEVREKVSKTRKGVVYVKSAEGTKNISTAARKRMLSSANPMKDKEIAKRTLSKTLTQVSSKFELNFLELLRSNNMDIVHTGQGTLWIGRRNPDFRVKEQKKVIELTQGTVFTPALGNVVRTLDNYGLPTIKHYMTSGWECLVVFLNRRHTVPPGLVDALTGYSLKESSWSGIWDFDQLIR